MKERILFSQLHSDSFTHLRIIWHTKMSSYVSFRDLVQSAVQLGALFGKQISTAQDPLVSSQSSPEDLQAYASKLGALGAEQMNLPRFWHTLPISFPMAYAQYPEYPMSIRIQFWYFLGTWRESRHVATMILAHRLDSLRLVRGKEGLYQCHQAGHRFKRFDIYRDSVELFPSV